ncbi:hypothetical protein LEP1GSC062_2568 [Leptospira alexanderi serovar Manhao 3 str. L 60]|uniref:Uncharacterized protein n=1 Tax=Leptospira alexanderi serovar Manhao 3 str. L 60 TaxID=1049759 RepID=V6IFL0_9LEPT|nr:hypothetical protein LEP1GSC062_2568 [Leptospira alexanderi serovar Manhao 3 str. L 60]
MPDSNTNRFYFCKRFFYLRIIFIEYIVEYFIMKSSTK